MYRYGVLDQFDSRWTEKLNIKHVAHSDQPITYIYKLQRDVKSCGASNRAPYIIIHMCSMWNATIHPHLRTCQEKNCYKIHARRWNTYTLLLNDYIQCSVHLHVLAEYVYVNEERLKYVFRI